MEGHDDSLDITISALSSSAALRGFISGSDAGAAKRPAPTFADFFYGTESERQRLDFWQARADGPAPVVVLIHGGAWKAGDKDLL